jgi:NAD(P)H-hydrate repair Nnr-like enzyme with NAD(P)H-hydrate epimerase domain
VAVDEQLMGPDLGFSVYQLMELAGLSVAAAIAEQYSTTVRVHALRAFPALSSSASCASA